MTIEKFAQVQEVVVDAMYLNSMLHKKLIYLARDRAEVTVADALFLCNNISRLLCNTLEQLGDAPRDVKGTPPYMPASEKEMRGYFLARPVKTSYCLQAAYSNATDHLNLDPQSWLQDANECNTDIGIVLQRMGAYQWTGKTKKEPSDMIRRAIDGIASLEEVYYVIKSHFFELDTPKRLLLTLMYPEHIAKILSIRTLLATEREALIRAEPLIVTEVQFDILTNKERELCIEKDPACEWVAKTRLGYPSYYNFQAK